MPDPLEQTLDAISFAARAHRHQLRKDRETPYAAHPFRVCLIVRQVFGVDDPRVLAAATLHDAIEDTPTDYDDLAERFGADVAGWVADLTKDMRLPEGEREREYLARLSAASWPVVVCKLADVYDNLTDSKHLPPDKRARTVTRSREYLDALRRRSSVESARALSVTEAKLNEVAGG